MTLWRGSSFSAIAYFFLRCAPDDLPGLVEENEGRFGVLFDYARSGRNNGGIGNLPRQSIVLSPIKCV